MDLSSQVTTPSETAQATLVPMGEGWAAGVNPVSVSGSRRGGRLRWSIAGAVVLIVALLTAGGAFVLSGAGGQKSLTASVAPKNSVAFLEVRMDLPGDQRTKLADFMSHFPGFQDRALFNTALDQLLNRLVAAASMGVDYTSDFKPWMQGEFSLAEINMGSYPPGSVSLPMMGGATPTPAGPISYASRTGFTPPSAVAIFALKSRAAAEAWVTSQVGRLHLTVSGQPYAGTTIYASSGGVGAYAFTDQDLFVGTVSGVEAALDTRTKGSLADNADYQAAIKSLSGDSLARFFVAAKGLVTDTINSMNQMMGALASGASPLPTIGMSTTDVPAWVAGSVRAESGQMVVNVTMPRTASTNLGLGNHSSRLASVLPGSTVAVAEAHSIGKVITAEMAKIDGQAGGQTAATLAQVKDILSKIGGTDWIGDGVAVVTKDGATIGGGLVVEATDAATASTKEANITNLATLASATYHVTSKDETYKGVTITLITIPADVTGGIPLQIAVAAKDNLIVAGYTDAFVKAVIDTTSSTSLASQSDYSNLTGLAGSSNEASFYINVPAVEDQIGQSFSPSRWSADYKPYFDHVGGIAGSVIDGDTVILRFVISAR